MNRQQRRAASKQSSGGSPSAARSASPADGPFRSGLDHHRQGRLAAAEPFYRRALQLDPQHVESLNFLGVLSLQTGRVEESAALLGRALALAPDNAALHYNLGATCHAADRPEQAVACYRRAIQIQPDHRAAHNNLGLTLQELGRLEEAGDAFGKALALGDDPRVHCNLGRLCLAGDEPERAIIHYGRALSRAADNTEARVGLASAHLALGDPASALPEICRALARSDTQDARTIFVACVAAMPPSPVGETAARLLRRALQEGWGRCRDLARLAGSVVASRHAETAKVDALAGDALLTALLEAAPIVGRTLECLLTRARTTFLASIASGTSETIDVPFWCALAGQCFLNEYVFACTPDEELHVEALSERLAALLDSGAAIPAAWPIAVAAYRPLMQIPGVERLLSRPWPEPLRRLLARQSRNRSPSARYGKTSPN